MKVAVLGYGTVGKGVHDLLQDAPGFEAGPVLEKDERPDLPFAVTDLEAILSDPTVDAVVEAIGGIEMTARKSRVSQTACIRRARTDFHLGVFHVAVGNVRKI